MWRKIGGVVAGYIAIFVFVFASFTVAYLAMGQDRAYKPGSFEVSTLWGVTAISLGFIAAVIGGVVYTLIARFDRSALPLAIVVFVLGCLSAAMTLRGTEEADPEPRTGEVSSMEAMQKSRQPAWYAIVNPLIGAAGVMLGGSLLAKNRVNASVEPPAAAPD